MSETPEQAQGERRHPDAPAEGERTPTGAGSDERVHSQEPAEGAAAKAGSADRGEAGQDGHEEDPGADRPPG